MKRSVVLPLERLEVSTWGVFESVTFAEDEDSDDENDFGLGPDRVRDFRYLFCDSVLLTSGGDRLHSTPSATYSNFSPAMRRTFATSSLRTMVRSPTSLAVEL